MITATVTRPTTISPTISCDRKIYFVERIDISPLYPPKSRTITLEPVSRRKVAKDQARKLVDPADRKSRKTDSASRSDPPRDSNSTVPSNKPDSDPAMSPSPSQMSFESARSSNRHSQHESSSQSQSTSTNSRPNGSKSSIAVKNITTEVESCVGGCLRGDSIPVKVSVSHVKHIKSMNGVIVTLFRQARVDMHPAIPLGPTEKSANPKYEDYYPRSKTGLGGLSLSGAGSSHMFRKDLSQTVQPLIVDPGSLSSEVTVKVRVPEDCFPTISTVPGAMISFKYYVEVVVDIQGKLSSHERSTAGLIGATASAMSAGDELETDRGATGVSGAHMVDTAPARRDKGVVSATFEVVVGTRDSERRKGKQKEEGRHPKQQPERTQPDGERRREPAADEDHQNYEYPPEEGYWGYNHHDWYHGNPSEYDNWYYHDHGWQVPPTVPIPSLPEDSQLSEKELARRGEERLLPSQPPGMDGQASEGAYAPTAPYLPGEPVSDAYPMPTPAYQSRQPSLSGHPGGLQNVHSNMSAPAPEYFPTARPSNHRPADDKQEIRRRELEAEASAPPLEDDAGSSASETHRERFSGAMLHPSAPPIPEQPREGVDNAIVSVPNESHLNNDSHPEACGEIDLPQYDQGNVAQVMPRPQSEHETSNGSSNTAFEPISADTVTSNENSQEPPDSPASRGHDGASPLGLLQSSPEPRTASGDTITQHKPAVTNASAPVEEQTPGHER